MKSGKSFQVNWNFPFYRMNKLEEKNIIFEIMIRKIKSLIQQQQKKIKIRI